jgi:hypothetical protein
VAKITADRRDGGIRVAIALLMVAVSIEGRSMIITPIRSAARTPDQDSYLTAP